MKAGIVGAGIMGSLLGFALNKLGWNVTIYDQTKDDNCSMSAAGLLTPWTELEKDDGIIFDLGMAALNQHWPMLLLQLPHEIYFQRKGSLALAHPRDRSELDTMIQHCQRYMPASVETKKIVHEEIIELEPELNKFQDGYYFSEEGQIDNQSLLKQLEIYLMDKISWHKKTFVYDVQPNKVILKDRREDFDWVFDCRGLGAKNQFSDLRGIRGELIWLHAPEVSIQRPIRLFHPRYRLYVVPRPNQIYLLGASEIEAEDYSEISVRSILELLTAAYYIQPKFAEARVIKTVTQCRPTLADHRPKIKYTDGLIAVNGLYRHGFLIAPTLMSDVMNFMQHGVSSIDYPDIWEKIK